MSISDNELQQVDALLQRLQNQLPKGWRCVFYPEGEEGEEDGRKTALLQVGNGNDTLSQQIHDLAQLESVVGLFLAQARKRHADSVYEESRPVEVPKPVYKGPLHVID